ncbi:MAG TPA: helix-turn-helix domain-containing protein, partial [Symbiobacteriaceae bacterium]|nr:helix-turn-helix domain-containing protein [Symbiobacteriaceae bacterium]
MESTQERIVSAARRLFGEYGFHGTTTAEIARAAGIAEGTIYRHFKDKKELFIACVEPVIREAVRRETAVVSGDTPREILRNRIIERVRVVRENLTVFNILFTEGPYHPEIASILINQVMANIPTEEWEAVARAMEVGAFKRSPNPLIMNVGLTAAIWAMVMVGPHSRSLFANWPGSFDYDRLET